MRLALYLDSIQQTPNVSGNSYREYIVSRQFQQLAAAQRKDAKRFGRIRIRECGDLDVAASHLVPVPIKTIRLELAFQNQGGGRPVAAGDAGVSSVQGQFYRGYGSSSMSALAMMRSLRQAVVGIGRSRNRSRFSYRLCRVSTSVNQAVGQRFFRSVIGSQITRNLRARSGVLSPCHLVTFELRRDAQMTRILDRRNALKMGLLTTEYRKTILGAASSSTMAGL